MSIIHDISLAPSGKDKIDWVASYMPILNQIRTEFKQTKPFAGLKIAMSIHLEAKTAYLAKTLRDGGAEIHMTGCNPLSTQDDVAAAMAADPAGFAVYAKHGVSDEEYTEHLKATLSCCPDLIIDDGGDLISLLHGECRDYGKNLIGGCEETTTGIHRLQAREAAGLLNYPMIDVNDADCKHLFDNRYGTGQSTLDGIMNATNLIVAGKTFVITGVVHHFANREALKEFIEDRGGKAAGSVSSKTDYLINNDVTSTSGKNKKAQELGIPILSEEAFLELAGAEHAD